MTRVMCQSLVDRAFVSLFLIFLGAPFFLDGPRAGGGLRRGAVGVFPGLQRVRSSMPGTILALSRGAGQAGLSLSRVTTIRASPLMLHLVKAAWSARGTAFVCVCEHCARCAGAVAV